MYDQLSFPSSRRLHFVEVGASSITDRTAASISDVPWTPVRSLRRVLDPTINITGVARAGLDRDLYFVPSHFGTNPCDPRDHLSRHLVFAVGGWRPRPGELIAATGATYGLCSHYTAGRHTPSDRAPVRGAVIQGAFVFRSAHRHMAVPGDLWTTMTMRIYNCARPPLYATAVRRYGSYCVTRSATLRRRILVAFTEPRVCDSYLNVKSLG